MHPHVQQQLISYLVIAVVVILAIRRNMRGRKVRMEALWVFPALLVVVTGFVLSLEPRPGVTLAGVMAAALLAGAAIGWQRGRFTRIVLDPATHALTSQASPIGLMILGGVFIVRMAMRGYFLQTSRDPRMTLAVTDALLLFALGMISAQRLEMWIRCRRMLAEAAPLAP